MKSTYRPFATLAAVFLTSVFVLSPAPVKAGAAEQDVKFDETDVLEDLQSIEGFDIQNYPYYSSSEPEMYVINVVEYCYSFYENLRDNYGLYLYVYNPNGLYIDTDNYGNCVQIAVKYDSTPITDESKPMDYEKFSLDFCSVSTAPNTERLFYKFKVEDHVSQWDGKTIAERVNSNGRRYDISGIELVREGHSTAEDYPLTGKYSLDGKFDAYGSFVFTGYAAGYGPNQDAESTLDCKIRKLETVHLDVKHTFYRTQTSSKGPEFQNQIDTVYFSVPKRLFDAYGTLQRIKAEWYEYLTQPFLVTSNREYYDWISQYIGKRTDTVSDEKYFVTLPYELKPAGYHPYSIFGTVTDGVGSLFDWLIPPGHDLTDYVTAMWNVYEGYACQRDISPLYYIFNTKDWCDISEYDPYADDIETSGGVSSNRLYEYIKGYNKTIEKGYLPIKNGRISADLFEDDINVSRKMENERGKVQKGYSYYDFDASLDLQSWLSWSDVHDPSDESFWAKWRNYGFWNALFSSESDIPEEAGNTVAPIQVLTPKSGELALEDPQLSDTLLINSADVTEFRKECNDAFTVDGKDDEEKYVVLFRFAVTDYYSEEVWLGEWKDNRWDDYEKEQAYLAQETVFFDFDIIQLSFLKDEEWHVIAAVSNPIDIVNGISTPTHLSPNDGWPSWLKWTLAILALILILVVLWPILPYIIKAVVWVVTLPFKLIVMAVRGIKNAVRKRRRNDKE